MPYWLLLTMIVVFWLVAMMVIIRLIKGASRSRARQRAQGQSLDVGASLVDLQDQMKKRPPRSGTIQPTKR